MRFFRLLPILVAALAITALSCSGGGSSSNGGGNANLSNITISDGIELSPAFSSSVTSYTATAPSTATSCEITAFGGHIDQTLEANGNSITSEEAFDVSLSTTQTTVEITVTPGKGKSKTYTVVIKKNSSPSTESRLSNITITGSGSETLVPSFNSDTLEYNVYISKDTAQVTVTPVAMNSFASITVNNVSVASGSSSSAFAVTKDSSITIPVTGTAEDKTTRTYYSIIVHRAGDYSNNALLSSLVVTPNATGTITWDNTFTSSRTTYNLSVPNAISAITVTPTVDDTGKATVTVDGTAVTSGTASASIALTENVMKTISVICTAQDGTPLTYTINATRAGASSDNAYLSSLALLEGTLSPSFDKSVANYTTTVSSDSVTLTAVKEDTNATITVDSATYTSGASKTIALGDAGSVTTVNVVVTAQSGKLLTYSIAITRQSSLTIYFEKPSTWSEAWIWYDSDLTTTAWDTTALKTTPGDLTYYRTVDGLLWYKKELGSCTAAKFLFNDGTWNNKVMDVSNSNNDFSTTQSIWVRATGTYTYYDPVTPQPPTIVVSPTSSSFDGTSFSVSITISSSDTVTERSYTTVLNNDSPVTTSMSSNSVTVDVGADMEVGDVKVLQVTALNANGRTTTTQYTYTKVTPVESTDDFDNLRIYQVMVESFIDGDSACDFNTGYGSSHHKGDIQGVINSLDYMKDLGMNAVWMTPVFNTYGDSALDATGYYARNFFDIDPHFGDKSKLQTLVEEAHKRNMYVFLDGVFGHTGGNVTASPAGNYPSGGTDPVSYPGSLAFFKEVAEYWIKNYKIDGWRLDQAYQVSSKNQDRNYWKDIRETVEAACTVNVNDSSNTEVNGKKWGTLGYMVGEIWDGEANINTYGYNAEGNTGLKSCFDFPARYRVVQTFAQEESGKNAVDASTLAAGLATHSSYKEGSHPNLFISNHDVVRFGDLIKAKYNYYSENELYWKRYKAAISFMAAYSGPITLYYGDESGQATGGYSQGATWSGILDVARTSGKTSGFSTAEQDMHDYTKALMSMRAAHSALWQENTRTSLLSSGTVYADYKYDSATGDKVVYAVNTSTSSTTCTISQSATGGSTLTDLLGSDNVSASGGSYSVQLDPLEAKFFEVQ